MPEREERWRHEVRTKAEMSGDKKPGCSELCRPDKGLATLTASLELA
jgi:hypothetical protein